MRNIYCYISAETAEEMVGEKSHYINRFTEIHNKIYNKLKAKHEKIFQEEVLSNFSENTFKNKIIKDKLLKIKKKIEKEYSKKQCLNVNLIALNNEIYAKNDKERFGLNYVRSQSFLRQLENKRYNFWNCDEHGEYIKEILNTLKINNAKISSEPDHCFNLFQIEDKIFFYDLAYGNLVGEFTPEFFYKHCFLFGIQDFSVELRTDITRRMENTIKSFNEFTKTDRFEKILFPRIKEYVEAINYTVNSEKIDENLKNSFFFKDEFSKQINHHYKIIPDDDIFKSRAKFKKIHNTRSDIRKENDIFQFELDDVSESFQNLFKS